ncbi:MAG: DUF5947 family protein, partial [Limisphaerales bacterium]
MNKSLSATLGRFVRPRLLSTGFGNCDLCATGLPAQHRHLLEISNRKILCACKACALRFENVIGKFKLIPRGARPLPDFQMTDAQWKNLALPINLAFILQDSVTEKLTAIYPGPAGARESLLTFENWGVIVADNPELSNLRPDVEALLINRVGSARDYAIAPIDVCFELVGLIRKHWRGFSGGKIVWREIETSFSRFREWRPADRLGGLPAVPEVPQ